MLYQSFKDIGRSPGSSWRGSAPSHFKLEWQLPPPPPCPPPGFCVLASKPTTPPSPIATVLIHAAVVPRHGGRARLRLNSDVIENTHDKSLDGVWI